MFEIEESSRRRPDRFREGRPVTLADGQRWHIPRPLVVFTPAEGTTSGFVETLVTPDPDGRYLELCKKLRDSEGDYEYIEAEVEMIRYLLNWNYELSDAEIARLAPVCYLDEAMYDDEEDAKQGLSEDEVALTNIRKEIMKVTRGAAPKRRPGGTGSSATPAG